METTSYDGTEREPWNGLYGACVLNIPSKARQSLTNMDTLDPLQQSEGYSKENDSLARVTDVSCKLINCMNRFTFRVSY